MRSDDGDHTARPEDEPSAGGLLDRVSGFLLDPPGIFLSKRVLSHASAQNPAKHFLGFG